MYTDLLQFRGKKQGRKDKSHSVCLAIACNVFYIYINLTFATSAPIETLDYMNPT